MTAPWRPREASSSAPQPFSYSWLTHPLGAQHPDLRRSRTAASRTIFSPHVESHGDHGWGRIPRVPGLGPLSGPAQARALSYRGLPIRGNHPSPCQSHFSRVLRPAARPSGPFSSPSRASLPLALVRPSHRLSLLRSGVTAKATWVQGAWANGAWAQGAWAQGAWVHGVWVQRAWAQGAWVHVGGSGNPGSRLSGSIPPSRDALSSFSCSRFSISQPPPLPPRRATRRRPSHGGASLGTPASKPRAGDRRCQRPCP